MVVQILVFNDRSSGLFEYATLFSQGTEPLVLSEHICTVRRKSIWKRGPRLIERLDALRRNLPSEARLVHIVDNTPWTFCMILFCLWTFRDIGFILTMHDPVEHRELGWRRNLRRVAKNTLNQLSVVVSNRVHRFKIHFQNEKYPEQLGATNSLVFAHPPYRKPVKPKKRVSSRLHVGWFGRSAYNKGFDIFKEVTQHFEGHQSIRFTVIGVASTDVWESSNTSFATGFVEGTVFDETMGVVDLVLLPYRDVTSSGILMKCFAACTPWMASVAFGGIVDSHLLLQPQAESFIEAIEAILGDYDNYVDLLKECERVRVLNQTEQGYLLYERF